MTPTPFFHRLARRTTLILAFALLGGGLGLVAPPADDDEVNRRWLDKLDKLDRALLTENIGYAPPVFTDDLKWVDGDALSWKELRGKVVVLQSWTMRTTGGRGMPQRVQRALAEFEPDDVQMIALHTPEGAEKLETYLERRPTPIPCVIDVSGAYCDEIGAYKRPVNVVVDRNGTVRYAGLNTSGLKQAVAKLVEEAADESLKPLPRPMPDASVTDAKFPAFGGTISNAIDLRGQKAPTFNVQSWITSQPDARNKVVVIDFWATWCPPCVATIPHMNELANTFRSDVCAIGISDEQIGAFQAGLRKKNLNANSFGYALALDPTAKMKSALRVTGIPHCIVMSSDWMVRWQGHPGSLTPQTLRKIVDANRKLLGANSTRYRWTRG